MCLSSKAFFSCDGNIYLSEHFTSLSKKHPKDRKACIEDTIKVLDSHIYFEEGFSLRTLFKIFQDNPQLIAHKTNETFHKYIDAPPLDDEIIRYNRLVLLRNISLHDFGDKKKCLSFFEICLKKEESSGLCSTTLFPINEVIDIPIENHVTEINYYKIGEHNSLDNHSKRCYAEDTYKTLDFIDGLFDTIFMLSEEEKIRETELINKALKNII